jgi:hypothetical protein
MNDATVALQLTSAELDPEYLADLTGGLRAEILSLPVESVDLAPAGEPPPGAKAGEALAVGALVVSIAPALVESLMAIISSWLTRQPGDVELVIDGNRFRGRVSRAERERLVAAYLKRVDPEPEG